MDQFNAMLARWEPMVLSIFRIIVGLLLLQYGVAKILGYPAVLAVLHGEPRRMETSACGHPSRRARRARAPQDDGGVMGATPPPSIPAARRRRSWSCAAPARCGRCAHAAPRSDA